MIQAVRMMMAQARRALLLYSQLCCSLLPCSTQLLACLGGTRQLQAVCCFRGWACCRLHYLLQQGVLKQASWTAAGRMSRRAQLWTAVLQGQLLLCLNLLPLLVMLPLLVQKQQKPLQQMLLLWKQ